MTWSYSGNPASSRRDNLRFLVGDINAEDQLLSNEALKFFLDNFQNDYFAAAEACDAIYAKLGPRFEFERAKQFKERSKTLRMQAASTLTAFAGGIDTPKAFKRGPEKKFKRGMM